MIANKTKKFTIIEKAKVLRSIFTQGTGLMFRKKPDYGLIFAFRKERTIEITMFCVFYPIDILFLDKDKKVVDIKKGLKPFTDYFPKVKAMYVIELLPGIMKNTKIGDKLSFS
jgi:uncharacterized membrane protein (UPF0127 family)